MHINLQLLDLVALDDVGRVLMVSNDELVARGVPVERDPLPRKGVYIQYSFQREKGPEFPRGRPFLR